MVYFHFRWFWRSPMPFYLCTCRLNIVLVEWINVPIRKTGMKCLETIIGTNIPWLINTWLSSTLNDRSEKSSPITDILFSKNLPLLLVPNSWSPFYLLLWRPVRSTCLRPLQPVSPPSILPIEKITRDSVSQDSQGLELRVWGGGQVSLSGNTKNCTQEYFIPVME